jgi:hypothetical protein
VTKYREVGVDLPREQAGLDAVSRAATVSGRLTAVRRQMQALSAVGVENTAAAVAADSGEHRGDGLVTRSW